MVDAERETRNKAEKDMLQYQQDNDVLLISLKNENMKRVEFFEEYTEKEQMLNGEIKKLDKEKKYLREKEKVLRGYIAELTK